MYTNREGIEMNKNREGININKNSNFEFYEKQTATRGKWMQVFDEVKTQFMDLPDWAQGIFLEDISVALENRIAVMDKISK